MNILTCNHPYGHKRTWSVFCDHRNHRVWGPEYIDTQDRDISHSFQNPGTERERRQECLKEFQIIFRELTCSHLLARRRTLWADQNHLVPLLPNTCTHYRPFLRITHNPEIQHQVQENFIDKGFIFNPRKMKMCSNFGFLCITNNHFWYNN